MYEARYSNYITKNASRFAEPEEITAGTEQFRPDRPCAVGGVPLWYDGETLYVDNSDSHTMVVGPTGCKKTRTTVFTTVSTIIDAGESAVINDPKGEIYERTGEHARLSGADVRILNLRDPARSDCWNPLTLAYSYHAHKREDEAVACVNDFVDAVVTPSLNATNDRYWIDTARAYFTSLILMLMDSVPSAYFNISNVIQLSYQDNADSLKRIMNRMDPHSTAVFGLHTVLDLNAEKTSSCIFSSLLAMLNSFTQNKSLTAMLCENTIDLEKIGTRQTVIYVIYPDEKATLNFIVNSFLTQCYETLINVAGRTGASNPVRVNFVLDEFSNLLRIHFYENRISEARSRNIRYFLYIQSYSQLKEKYKECAETILSNCTNWLCFSSREMEFLEKISAVCGRQVDYNGIEHPLISPVEMQHLTKRRESADVLVLRSGMHPFVSTLPDFDTLPDISAYPRAELGNVKSRRKAKLLTCEEWIRGIACDKFSFPYPKVH